MQEAFADRELLDAATLRSLAGRRDGPGLLRFGVQCALFFVTGAALVSAPGPWVWPALLLHAATHLSFFASLHESAHGTAFATGRWNTAVAWLSSISQFMAPAAFRAFHFAHHRHTHDVAEDPELAHLAFLARWPTGLLGLAHLSGLPVLFARVAGMLGAVLGLPFVWDRILTFVRPQDRHDVQRESMILLALHLSLFSAAWLLDPRLLRLWAALLPAHALLSVYIAAEHRGLATEGSVLQRTRSFSLPAPLTFLMWNMPWHAEHHGWPMVPFHGLPKLRAALRAPLPHEGQSLWGLWRRGGRD